MKIILSKVTSMFNTDIERNVFKKYIEHIRFPHFKNFDVDFKITFNYPITFIVGPNGTGKSSLLQALYGCPSGKSLGNYWFNTKLDPIKDKHYLIYGYKTEITKTNVEVIKQRVHKDNDPDYWEPSRPNKSFGMQDVTPNANPEEAVQTRWNVLKKEVLYLDFRHELSSYDKYFYFGFKPNTTKMKSKQDLIRQYAPKLQEAYTKNCSTYFRSMKTSIPEVLKKEELEIISKILGKEYVEAKILKHDFYKKMEGFSVFYKTQNYLNYSEAFAGSGETAVVKLVHDIYKAEKYTLVILDEPETSLHPAAQKHLVKFLLDQITKKQLQIVISTHSSDLIEDMPKESIKVLFERKDNNKIDAIENVVPSEAFYHIGRSVSNKKTILVEDKLAKNIIEKTIQEYGGESLANMFQIKYFPGGESRLKLDFMPTYSKVKDGRHFFIFDGDMRVDKIDVNMLSKNDKSKSNLTELIRSLINTDPSKISFAHDSGNSGQELEQMLDLIKFHHDNVFFLPKNIPEEIIWDNEILTKADISISDKENIKNCLIKNNGQITATYKEAFKIFAKCMFDNDSSVEIEQGHNYFLKRWLEKKDDSYTDIVKTIEILKSYN